MCPSLEGAFDPGHMHLPEEGGSRSTNEEEREVMAETRLLERLTASDLFMLWAYDFGWSQDIGVLAILDGTRLLDGDGRVRIEAVRRAIEPRLPLVPRFRQLLYRTRRGLGWPLWVDAQSFDLADHVQVFPLAAPGDQAQLLQACAQLYRRRLDPSRPLWEAWLLPGLPQRRVGLFLRAHHTVADGVAGMAAFGALLDLAADVPVPAAAPWTPTPIPSAGELLRDNLRRRLQGLGRGLSGLARPSRTRRGAPAGWREFFAERAPRTSLNRPIGADRRLAVVRSRLDLTKQVAHAHHAKVTNVPGPPVPLYLAGARLLELFPVPPIQGNVTLTVGVLSYAGQLNLTAIADRDTCPDVELFAQGVRSALDDLTRSVLVPAS